MTDQVPASESRLPTPAPGSDEESASASMIPYVLNPSQRIIVGQRTPPQHIRFRKGRGGREYPYTDYAYVVFILNEAFGWAWDFETGNERILEAAGKPFEVQAKGRLTIHTRAGTIVKEQWGGVGVEFMKDDPNTPVSLADAFKGASTDALKKCASLVGVAIDVYDTDSPVHTGRAPTPPHDKLVARFAELAEKARAMGLDPIDTLDDFAIMEAGKRLAAWISEHDTPQRNGANGDGQSAQDKGETPKGHTQSTMSPAPPDPGAAQSESAPPTKPNGKQFKPAVLKGRITARFEELCTEFANHHPAYRQANGIPDRMHILGALAAEGFAQVTAENIEPAFEAIGLRARQKAQPSGVEGRA